MIDKNTIALQLYTVRDDLAHDFSGTLRKVASYGYRAVEVASFPSGISAEAAKSVLDELDLQVIGAHSPLPLGDSQTPILENMAILDAAYLICPQLNPEIYYKDMDGIKNACEMLNEANQVAKSAGLILAYHNHWFEMEKLDDKLIYQHMLAYLDTDIQFELDTYWAKVAGLNPVNVIHELKDRLPLMHLKDGAAANTEDDMVALGDGMMDIRAIAQVSPAQWHIVELDRCASDMLTAVHDSYTYLIELSQ